MRFFLPVPRFFYLVLPMLFHVEIAVAQADYRVERYNVLNGLSSAHWVNGVQMDSAGMLWLALNQGGLARFDGGVFVYYPLPAEWKKHVWELTIHNMLIDQEGKFWVNAWDKMLYFDPETGKYSMPNDIDGLPNGGIICLRKTRSGALVFLSNGYLYSRRHAGEKFGLIAHLPLKDIDWDALDIEENEQGELWVLTLHGVYRHVPGNPDMVLTTSPDAGKNPFPLVPPHATRFIDSPSGFIWYSDASGVAKKINKKGEIVERYDLPESKHLFGVLETEDLRWFGTFDGLIKISRRRQYFQRWLDQPFDLSQGPPTVNSCYGLAEALDGSIYTTVELGLHEIKPLQAGQSRIIREVPASFRRYGMVTDREGAIWLSRYGYFVDRYDPQARKIQRVSYEPSNGFSNSLFQDKSGRIWVACEYGIVWIDAHTKATHTFPLPEQTFVWHFCETDDGTIWVATKSGILKISPASGEVQRFSPSNTPGMASGELLSIHEAEGFFWCGSTSGLLRFDPQRQVAATFTTRHGLPHNHVYAAIPAEGSLWLPTNKGLARVSLASIKAQTLDLAEVDIFGADDGLPHHEFNTMTFLKAKNGAIWLGGLNGVVSFDPKKLILKALEGKSVLIAEFSKFDQHADSVLNFPVFKAHCPTPFVLRPEEKFFTVRFALLDYRDPKANQYSYKLEGIDPDWVFAGNQNTARYANLPPGQYTLRVRGGNPNGIWSSREATAVIVVQQVWYKTGWAWALYILFAVGAMYGAWRNRVRRLRLTQKLELELLRSENLKSLEAFKNRFFTNITHEFRTPLTVILGMTGQLKKALESGRPNNRFDVPALLSQTTIIHRNGENLLWLVNQILDLVKLESNSLKINYVQGDVVGYLRYVAKSLHSLAETRDIRLSVKSHVEDVLMDYDPDRLLQIVYNLLSNSLKFTPPGGEVRLLLDRHRSPEGQENLMVQVGDTGVGIPPEDLPFVFDRFFQADNQEQARVNPRGKDSTGIGLSLTKELVKMMGGTISVESRQGEGTIFTVLLPVHNTSEQVMGEIGDKPVLEPMAATAPRAHKAPTAGSGTRLLIVEDNPDVMEYLAACLRDQYALDFAYDGQRGIERALETAPDIIISDVMMPEKNGFELCETLKSDERSSHIPIVLLTAKADMDSRLAGLRHGADAYLAKPFHSEELSLTLNNLLELRRQMQARYLDWAVKDMPATPTAADPENDFLKKLRSVVEENLSDSNLDVEAICRKIGMSRTNLHNKLSALTGLSTTLYVRKLRLRRAHELLLTTHDTIAAIAYDVGFNDPKFFSRVYAEEYGVPPSEERKKSS